MGLAPWSWFGRRTLTEIDASVEGTIEELVMNAAEQFAKDYWTFFLDRADESNKSFMKAAKKHLRYTPPDADRVVVRTWLLALTAMNLQRITLERLTQMGSFQKLGPGKAPLVEPDWEPVRSNPRRMRRNQDYDWEAYIEAQDVAREQAEAAAAARERAAEEQRQRYAEIYEEFGEQMGRAVSPVEYAEAEADRRAAEAQAQATREAEAATLAENRRIAEANRKKHWEREQKIRQGWGTHPMADRLVFFVERIQNIKNAWATPQFRDHAFGFRELICPDPPSRDAVQVMNGWVQEHVPAMVDLCLKFTDNTVKDTVVYLRKTLKLDKKLEESVRYLVVGSLYFEAVNEIVRQAGLNVNPEALRHKYLGT